MGIDTVAAALSEPRDALEDIEMFYFWEKYSILQPTLLGRLRNGHFGKEIA